MAYVYILYVQLFLPMSSFSFGTPTGKKGIWEAQEIYGERQGTQKAWDLAIFSGDAYFAGYYTVYASNNATDQIVNIAFFIVKWGSIKFGQTVN